MTTDKDGQLRRSHAPYSWRPLAVAYLIVAVTTLAIVGISLISEPPVEIVNGLPFVIGNPGLDCSATANVSQWNGWFGPGFLGFNRLVPVAGQGEIEAKAPLMRSRNRKIILGRLPIRPIFGERDLMSRLEVGTIYYTITDDEKKT